MAQETMVTTEDVVGAIKEVLEALEVSAADVTGKTTFEALGLDSLDLVELSVRIEDVYSVDIEEDDLKEVKTVGDAADVVLRKLASA
jgi:acyl carrier protein